jgi:hypothetical protein
MWFLEARRSKIVARGFRTAVNKEAKDRGGFDEGGLIRV